MQDVVDLLKECGRRRRSTQPANACATTQWRIGPDGFSSTIPGIKLHHCPTGAMAERNQGSLHAAKASSTVVCVRAIYINVLYRRLRRYGQRRGEIESAGDKDYGTGHFRQSGRRRQGSRTNGGVGKRLGCGAQCRPARSETCPARRSCGANRYPPIGPGTRSGQAARAGGGNGWRAVADTHEYRRAAIGARGGRFLPRQTRRPRLAAGGPARHRKASPNRLPN